MKLAYSVATPEASGSLMSFWGDFPQNVADIKAIGYDALELFVRDPKKMDISSVAAVIKDNDLSVAAIGTNPALSQDGLSLLNPDKDTRERAIARVLDMVDFAATWGAPVCIGKFRGQLWAGKEEESWKILADAIQRIATAAAHKGVSIAIEPQGSQSINNLNTVSETLEWFDKNNIANTTILYDLMQGDIAETSVATGIVAAKDKLSFVHCSDSNRMPPGTGHIHIADAIAVLKAMGYGGAISMEIAQKPDSYTVAELSCKVVRFILGSLR